MTFESLIASLNKKGFLLDGLTQTSDGKKWSARVRKNKSTAMGYGTGLTFESAIKKAATSVRDSFDPKGFAKLDAPLNPKDKEKRRRVRIRKK